jgi:serine/threonine protein kinase
MFNRERFIEWCQVWGCTPVSMLQEHSDNKDFKSLVWLIRDSDGLYKVLKEKPDYSQLVGYLDEKEISDRLPRYSWIPRYYGRINIYGYDFFSRSYLSGQPLSHYCHKGHLLSEENVWSVLQDISTKLQTLLNVGAFFLDLRPENLLLTCSGVSFPDLGLIRFSETRVTSPVVVNHPRYCAPEVAKLREASEKSIVFQLGILAQELLTGEHPFDAYPLTPPTTSWEQSTERYLLPAMEGDSNRRDETINNNYISRMLDHSLVTRSTLCECIEFFEGSGGSSFVVREGFPVASPKENTVLFPARMGIPHKGHIEYMGRILDLGYHLSISIQRAYTITENDPLPKWLVMKMVARSLLDQGYPRESFDFTLCPFYRTSKEMQTHFEELPGRENIVAVASNNPTIHDLFEDHPIILQKDVLGFEGELFETRSWGEILRKAVRRGDYQTYKEYAASGVLEMFPNFANIQAACCKYPIEFVPGQVFVQVVDPAGVCIVNKVMPRYITPEEAIAEELGVISELYADTVKIFIKGKTESLVYVGTSFTEGNEHIHFKLY